MHYKQYVNLQTSGDVVTIEQMYFGGIWLKS
jgi:hypothetical protein